MTDKRCAYCDNHASHTWNIAHPPKIKFRGAEGGSIQKIPVCWIHLKKLENGKNSMQLALEATQ